MADTTARSETSLALAMMELDRLERERQTFQTMRREARAALARQAGQLKDLGDRVRAQRPRALARALRKTEHEAARARMAAEQRAMIRRTEHDELMAELARANAERRARLEALELERASEPPTRASAGLLAWLAPVACAAVLGLFAMAMVRNQPVDVLEIEQPVVGEAAAVEIELDDRAAVLDVAEPVVAEPVVAEPVVVDAAVDEVEAPVSEPVVKKPTVKKPTVKKPKPVEPGVTPISKPRENPLVLSGGDDPLG